MKPLERRQDILSKLYRLAPPKVWICAKVIHRIKIHLFFSKAAENRKCRTLVRRGQISIEDGELTWTRVMSHWLPMGPSWASSRLHLKEQT